jgi:hypothetical protein
MSTTNPPPRRPWYRYLYQFSLRTLLIATTLAAVACWWWLRPERREEELAGQHLKLRRQVKLSKETDPKFRDPAFNVGSWELVNEHGDRLVLGRYADDVRVGRWRLYYPHGQRAAEGKLAHGVRDGLWRMWDEAGALRSEVTFRAVERRDIPIAVRPFVGHAGVMNVVSSASFDPAAPEFVCERHGPAHTWHGSGKLASEGAFESDRRSGVWKWYDAAGSIVRRAEYRDGVEVADRTEQHASLAKELRSGDLRTQLAAAERLEQLASQAVPTLVESLDASDRAAQLLALRALERLEAITSDQLPQLEKLAAESVAAECPPLALRATLLLYALQPAQHDRHFARFEKLADRISPLARVEALLRIAELDESRRELALATAIDQMAHNPLGPSGYLVNAYSVIQSYDDAARVAALRFDLVPALTTAFDSSDPVVRSFALLVVRQLVERNPPIRRKAVLAPGEPMWEIPADLIPLVDRALKDTDPLIRNQAEQIGQMQPSQVGGGFF